MSDPQADPLCVVQLPLSVWRIAIAHLQASPFPEVGHSISVALFAQIQPQVAAAAAAQQARVIEEARNLAEAADVAKCPRTSEPSETPEVRH